MPKPAMTPEDVQAITEALHEMHAGSYAFGNTCPESSSYRPVREELGAQCIPRISRLVGFFDRFISLLPGSLLKECLLDVNLVYYLTASEGLAAQ
jgi:hypothetical protein